MIRPALRPGGLNVNELRWDEEAIEKFERELREGIGRIVGELDPHCAEARFVEELQAFLRHPAPPCDRGTAVKLLKKLRHISPTLFYGPDFSVTPYLPAVIEGTMKLAETVYAHDCAVAYARTFAEGIFSDLYGTEQRPL